MIIYSYPMEKKRKIFYNLSLDGSFLVLWTISGLGRDITYLFFFFLEREREILAFWFFG